MHERSEGEGFGSLLDQGNETGCFGDVEFCVEDGDCVHFLVCLLASLVLVCIEIFGYLEYLVIPW